MSNIVIKKKAPKDAVGYKRPPKAHRFKPGQSGNPKGRPKGVPTLQDVMIREAARIVRVKQGDRIENIPKLAAVARSVYSMALKGDIAAARMIFQHTADAESSQTGVSEGLTMPTDDVIQRMMKRFEHLTASKGGKG